MKKRILVFCLCLLILMGTTAFAAKKTPMGAVIATDIVAMIDLTPIESYNINQDSYVFVDDLKNYGFDVGFSDSYRITRKSGDITYMPFKEKLNIKKDIKIGKKIYNVYKADVKIFVDGGRIEGVAVNGKIMINLALLKGDGNLVWDGARRIIRLVTMQYDAEIVDKAIAYVEKLREDEDYSKKLAFKKNKNVLVLLYHSIIDFEKMSEYPDPIYTADPNSVYTTVKTFEKHIKMLKDAGYKSLSLEQYYRNEYNKKQKYFILTFDDGSLNNYENAFPIIKEQKVYADMFINTDNKDIWRYFTFKQANEMEEGGLVKVYSHFTEHIDVLTESDEVFGILLDKTFQTLNDNMEKGRYKFFAYPFGIYDKAKYNKAIERGVNLQMVQKEKFSCDNLIFRHNIFEKTNMQRLIKHGKLN